MPISALLVDDNPAFLDSVTRFLAADERIEIVGQAVSGAEAIAQVARLKPDLVLMDVAMPGMNGLEATRYIKSQRNAPGVVVVTLSDNPETRSAAAAVRADGFIPKAEFCQQIGPLLDELEIRSALPGREVSKLLPRPCVAAVDILNCSIRGIYGSQHLRVLEDY